jgi:hypothetical protein
MASDLDPSLSPSLKNAAQDVLLDGMCLCLIRPNACIWVASTTSDAHLIATSFLLLLLLLIYSSGQSSPPHQYGGELYSSESSPRSRPERLTKLSAPGPIAWASIASSKQRSFTTVLTIMLIPEASS